MTSSEPPFKSPRYREWDSHLQAIADIIQQWRKGTMPDENAARAIAAIITDRERADAE